MSNLHDGARKPRTWSEEEKQKLMEVYPHKTKEEILPMFPSHSYNAIMANANLLGLHKTKEIIGKQASQSCINKKLWESIKNAVPTKPEIRMMEIISRYNFPFKYVGDNSIIIYGLNPDFINSNGKKQIIEVFGRAFHDPNKSFLTVKPQRQEKIRKKIYASVGYNCFIFWDDEMKSLSDEDIANRINEFMGEK